MYLNGNRLKAAAKARRMDRKAVQQASGLSIDILRYYWDNAITVTSEDDLKALAKALHIPKPDILLVKGQPKAVALRPDKFVSQADDITFKKQS